MFVNFTVTFLNETAVLLFGIIHITCTSLLFIGTPSKSTALTLDRLKFYFSAMWGKKRLG